MSKIAFIEEMEKIQKTMLKGCLNEEGYEINDPKPIKIHIPGDTALKSIKHISDFSAFMMQKKLDEYMNGPQESDQDLYDFNPVNHLNEEASAKTEESMYQFAASVGADVQELTEDDEMEGSGAGPGSSQSGEATEDSAERSGSETESETNEVGEKEV